MKRAVVRLSPGMLGRLDALRARICAANPGRRVSRAALVRELTAVELAAVEQDGRTLEEFVRRVVPPRAPRKHRPRS
jgi:hypothetical protein